MLRLPPERLLTLPPAMARQLPALYSVPPAHFACSDPVGSKLGSGGGTANLLVEAWRATAPQQSFQQWLQAAQKLIIHSGGQSRRLPAYATVGKAFMPVPVLRWSSGQRLDQTLLDLQAADYSHVLEQAPARSAVLVASGDVFLRFDRQLPALPDVDVLCLGMWVTPESAERHGVFFCPRSAPAQLDYFLQKPPAAEIHARAATHLFLVDTGLWLLSARAIAVLLERCGWNSETSRFDTENGLPRAYELYSDFGLGLGLHPTRPDPACADLTSAVVALPRAEFHHLGTNRELISSITRLQNAELDQVKLGVSAVRRHPDQFILNSRFEAARGDRQPLWIENSTVPATWRLAGDHVITGAPDNAWRLSLPPGLCLDFVPVLPVAAELPPSALCLRFYAFSDPFSGLLGSDGTRWLRSSAKDWFAARSIPLEVASGLNPDLDLQRAPLFPVFASAAEIDDTFIQWLIDPEPEANAAFTQRYLDLPRLSAEQLGERADLLRLYAQRRAHFLGAMPRLIEHSADNFFTQLDLAATASSYHEALSQQGGEPVLAGDAGHNLATVRAQMFNAALLRLRRDESAYRQHEARAFSLLQELVLEKTRLQPAEPRCSLLEDQIIWGRAPIRIDLAGGWSDTPPYCLLHGGQVVNVAIDLNGQPPVQVFARRCPEPELILRSIDLGAGLRIRTYEELLDYADPKKPFALARAALCLSGFAPQFHAQGGAATLEQQLKAFGGGLEISLLAAAPKGSGLGTSSILSATLLGTLSKACGLGWDRPALVSRTLALEQMLTTGGGWQDQAGGIYPGIKLVETQPGLVQTPAVRWLPDNLFTEPYANRTVLLYYTGITRLAADILHEIVRGMFLNDRARIEILDEIRAHALNAYSAIQRDDYPALCATIRRSWQLNQALDRGTNPPAVQAILDQVADFTAAVKLPGAGGGGYALFLAKDPEAGARLRAELEKNPPNAKARFVELSLSRRGLEVTQS